MKRGWVFLAGLLFLLAVEIFVVADHMRSKRRAEADTAVCVSGARAD